MALSVHEPSVVTARFLTVDTMVLGPAQRVAQFIARPMKPRYEAA
jgi:hypothetical protein